MELSVRAKNEIKRKGLEQVVSGVAYLLKGNSPPFIYRPLLGKNADDNLTQLKLFAEYLEENQSITISEFLEGIGLPKGLKTTSEIVAEFAEYIK